MGVSIEGEIKEKLVKYQGSSYFAGYLREHSRWYLGIILEYYHHVGASVRAIEDWIFSWSILSYSQVISKKIPVQVPATETCFMSIDEIARIFSSPRAHNI